MSVVSASDDGRSSSSCGYEAIQMLNCESSPLSPPSLAKEGPAPAFCHASGSGLHMDWEGWLFDNQTQYILFYDQTPNLNV